MNTVPTETLDVLIVGAGISGIGVGRYLRTEHPEKTFAILEGRDRIGGTWDLFTYPGIRSDSDLYTFGYDFKPWRDKETIAGAPRILAYLQEAVDDNGLAPYIRFGHKVISAEWNSDAAIWSVEVHSTTPDGASVTTLSARWIFCAGGYYNYDSGYTPEFPGVDDFTGQIVHPQHWPEDLDYADKDVVVIGSGATAVTLVPAMAPAAKSVTMLQRTPTYIMPVPREDPTANLLKKILPAELAHRINRAKYVQMQRQVYAFCRRHPKLSRRIIRAVNTRLLPKGYPVDTHFNPPYDPWDQRLCAVPGGDLFRTIARGEAEMVTDRIATFTQTGIRTDSGRHLDADIIVTATGLTLQTAGGIKLSVDGRPVDVADSIVYRGMLLSGVPNFALAIGYTNASWTLKVGLMCEYFVKLLSHMDAHGYDVVRPEVGPDVEIQPALDLSAGYVQRGRDTVPKQGTRAPWAMSKDYIDDRRAFRRAGFTDEYLHFSAAPTTDNEKSPVAAGRSRTWS